MEAFRRLVPLSVFKTGVARGNIPCTDVVPARPRLAAAVSALDRELGLRCVPPGQDDTVQAAVVASAAYPKD